MSASFDSRVSGHIINASPVLVPGFGEVRLAAIASWKFIQRCGFAINLGESISRWFLTTLFGQFFAGCGVKGEYLPTRECMVRLSILLEWGLHSDITYQSPIHLPCQSVVKPVLSLSSVRTLKRPRYTTSGCSIALVEEDEFDIYLLE